MNPTRVYSILFLSPQEYLRTSPQEKKLKERNHGRLSKKFKWVGWLGILSPFFILFFYCALGGYCIKYTVLNIGDLFHASFGANALAEQAATNGTSLGAEVFGAFMANPNELMIGWELGPDVVKDECEASGHAMSGYGFFKVCVKFITPLCMILVLYGQIKEFFF